MSIESESEALFRRLSQPSSVETAFLALFRFISESGASFGWLPLGPSAVEGFDSDRQVALWNEELRSSIAASAPFYRYLDIADIGGALKDISARKSVTREASKSLVIALRVLDEAFRGVHPGEVFSSSDGQGFVIFRTRVRSGEPLFAEDNLVVFPKPRRVASRQIRGQRSLGDLLCNLAVVTTNPSLRVVNLSLMSAGSPGPEGFRRVGIIPTVNCHQELLWTKEPNGGYSVRENPAFNDEINDRLRNAISELVREGADLVLMPELVSSAATDGVVEDMLSECRRAGHKTPCLFLAGTKLETDGVFTKNRAVVFNGEGEVAWRQDKMHAYTFSADEQARAGHPLGIVEVADRFESIDIEPRTLYIVDISPTQRIVVLTCEDLAQPEPHPAILRDIVATTVLVPVMSCAREGEAAGWFHEAAVAYTRHPGSTSVIANSGALLAGREEHWQYGHLVAEPRVDCTWRALRAADGGLLAWLAETPRLV